MNKKLLIGAGVAAVTVGGLYWVGKRAAAASGGSVSAGGLTQPILYAAPSGAGSSVVPSGSTVADGAGDAGYLDLQRTLAEGQISLGQQQAAYDYQLGSQALGVQENLGYAALGSNVMSLALPAGYSGAVNMDLETLPGGGYALTGRQASLVSDNGPLTALAYRESQLGRALTQTESTQYLASLGFGTPVQQALAGGLLSPEQVAVSASGWSVNPRSSASAGYSASRAAARVVTQTKAAPDTPRDAQGYYAVPKPASWPEGLRWV